MRVGGYKGGIYMASTVDDTTCIWDALIDNRVDRIVDKHGECEHLRSLLSRSGLGRNLRGGELVWMTDRTPHEALPLPSNSLGTYRQFFRVVSPPISRWYAKHSTPNPKVPVPSSVQIIHESKFD